MRHPLFSRTDVSRTDARAVVRPLVLVVALTACHATTPVRVVEPSAAALGEATRVLDDFHDAAAHADETRYFSHFAEGAVFLGTDAGERWDMTAFRAYAHPHFAAGKGWTFHPQARRLAVTSNGAVAWFDEVLASPGLGPCRGSGVLVASGATWRIAQYNLTVTVPNPRMAEVKKLLESPPPPAPPLPASAHP